MKTCLKMFIPGVLLFMLLGGPAFGQTRIATVNVQKVFDGYYKTKQADAALREQAAEVEKTYKEMMAGYRAGRDDYQKLLADANDQAVSTEERDKRKKAAEEKLREVISTEETLKGFDRQSTTRLGEQRARTRKNLLDEISLAIASKAKAGNYSLVIDSGSQTYVADPMGAYYTPTVLYNSGEADLTDAVLDQLNAGAPLDTPAAEEKPQPAGDKPQPAGEQKK